MTRGADRTLHTQPPPANPRPPGVSTGGARDVGPDRRDADRLGRPEHGGHDVPLRVRHVARRTARRPQAAAPGSGDRSVSVTAGDRRPAGEHAATTTASSPRTRPAPRAGATARSSARGGPTGVSIGLDPARVTWSRPLAVTGRVSGAGAGGAPLALEAQAWPFSGSITQIATRDAASNGTLPLHGRRRCSPRRASAWSRARRSSPRAPWPPRRAPCVSGPGCSALSRRRARVQGTIWPAVPKRPRVAAAPHAQRPLGARVAPRRAAGARRRAARATASRVRQATPHAAPIASSWSRATAARTCPARQSRGAGGVAPLAAAERRAGEADGDHADREQHVEHARRACCGTRRRRRSHRRSRPRPARRRTARRRACRRGRRAARCRRRCRRCPAARRRSPRPRAAPSGHAQTSPAWPGRANSSTPRRASAAPGSPARRAASPAAAPRPAGRGRGCQSWWTAAPKNAGTANT